MHADWLNPDWPAPPNVGAIFTTRSGGVSVAPHDSMNLGDHVGDAPVAVTANREALQKAMATRAVFLKQVHGCEVLTLAATTAQGLPADACVTTQRSLACTIMVADCLPVLLTTTGGHAVAAAHAGWRGLVGLNGLNGKNGHGILESFYATFNALASVNSTSNATTKIAWLGPCIGPSAFEVGAEVKAAFESGHADVARCFVQTGADKYLADLAGLARLRLQALGITQIYGNDGGPAWCTVSNPERFFSHRRDTGKDGNSLGTTGRMAACIWLK